MANSIKIHCKFKFLDEVIVNVSGAEDLMMITDIQIKADGSSIYGCMNASGETKWFREYELELSNTPKSRLGFTVEIVADERQD